MKGDKLIEVWTATTFWIICHPRCACLGVHQILSVSALDQLCCTLGWFMAALLQNGARATLVLRFKLFSGERHCKVMTQRHRDVADCQQKIPASASVYLRLIKALSFQKLIIDEKKFYLFGRNPDWCDFTIDHQSCSRVHAALVYHKHLKRVFLIDLNSSKTSPQCSLCYFVWNNARKWELSQSELKNRTVGT